MFKVYSFSQCLYNFTFPAVLRNNWQISIYLNCMTWWFDICLHCKMITTMKFINTFILKWIVCVCVCVCVCMCVCAVRMLKMFQQMSSTQHSITDYSLYALYRNPRTYSFYNCNFVPFDQHLSTSSTYHPPLPPALEIIILLLSMTYLFF